MEKQVRLILGPSRSNVAESAGATAKYYNMIQVCDTLLPTHKV